MNLDQLNAALANTGGGSLAAANAYTDKQVTAARKFAAQGIAATAAILSVTPSAVGKTALGVGTGYYDGEAAIGLSISNALRERWLLSAGIAASGSGKPVARAGLALEF